MYALHTVSIDKDLAMFDFEQFTGGGYDKKIIEYVKYKYTQEREAKITIKAWTSNVSEVVDGELQNIKLIIECEVKSKYGLYYIRLAKLSGKEEPILQRNTVKAFNGGDAELFRIFAIAIIRDIDGRNNDFVRFATAIFKALFPISSRPKEKRCETCDQPLPKDYDEYEYAEE